jgi:hypothetical protein
MLTAEDRGAHAYPADEPGLPAGMRQPFYNWDDSAPSACRSHERRCPFSHGIGHRKQYGVGGMGIARRDRPTFVTDEGGDGRLRKAEIGRKRSKGMPQDMWRYVARWPASERSLMNAARLPRGRFPLRSRRKIVKSCAT